ncbi:MAG TPA: hypothetical protein VHL30_00040, partial [Chlamydiales bacterium]|nr:hypothetical protein [Chlamydiales bacterium]
LFLSLYRSIIHIVDLAVTSQDFAGFLVVSCTGNKVLQHLSSTTIGHLQSPLANNKENDSNDITIER